MVIKNVVTKRWQSKMWQSKASNQKHDDQNMWQLKDVVTEICGN
jgi:hypothetical protein